LDSIFTTEHAIDLNKAMVSWILAIYDLYSLGNVQDVVRMKDTGDISMWRQDAEIMLGNTTG